MIPFTVKLAAQMANARDEIAKLTAERDALLANAMTEEKAREIISGLLNSKCKTTGWLFGNDNICAHFIDWGQGKGDVSLEGDFTAEQLRAIAWWMESEKKKWWMENKGGGR